MLQLPLPALLPRHSSLPRSCNIDPCKLVILLQLDPDPESLTSNYIRLTLSRVTARAADTAISINAKTPDLEETGGCGIKCLAMTYSRMGRPHTTIGDDAFHF